MAIGTGNDRLMSDINVTPFVDVMLVLLIIFMVTAPMMTQGVDVTLPEASSGPLPAEKEKQLIVTIDKNNVIFINKYPATMETLQEQLRQHVENQRERQVYLRADKNISYGFVVRVMSEIKNAGIEKLGMVTVPLDEQEEKKK
jgi:biopolymer transport protein TolR